MIKVGVGQPCPAARNDTHVFTDRPPHHLMIVSGQRFPKGGKHEPVLCSTTPEAVGGEITCKPCFREEIGKILLDGVVRELTVGVSHAVAQHEKEDIVVGSYSSAYSMLP
jgi:hypothetical protein